MAQSGRLEDASAVLGQSHCPQCGDLFSDPRVLPCLHTLCMRCLQDLEPFSAQERGQSALCPVCDSEVSLPLGGVTDLLPDLLAQNQVLLERLRCGGGHVPCDLCGDGKGEWRCLDCKVTVCEFCCQAHRRQKRTAEHSLLPIQDLPPGSSLSPLPVCSLHALEELRLFCESCSLPSCRDCALVKHLGHEMRPVPEVAGRHRAELQGALAKSEPQLEVLEAALHRVQEAEDDLTRSAEVLRQDVEAFTEGYMRAVQEHRLRLLQDIEEEVLRKDQALTLQRARLRQHLTDLRTSTTFTRGLLERGPDLQIVQAKTLVVSRLKELKQGDYIQQVQTEGIVFNPKEEAGLCQGYQVYGAVQRGCADPERCQVRGQGLQSVYQGRLCSFTLSCSTKSGERLEKMGATPKITILQKESGRSLQASIQDKEDGTYQISYTPVEAGHLSISVCIRGRHIRGSPFSVAVRGTWRQHRGIYHCCTFCSSGGQKDARCGCGGRMPGGFQGCGHGHKGHPGQSHWSCCGSTAETSECSGVKDSAPRHLLRTVAL
ncbi:E3 ubiquitin-protein ligase TRIM45 [Engystomops pustulosus]|uniref:E3 ubiquitin-protein ligase TRIM45 n=1 Tax=Engystomops pustulosus TaxID=76066 RepID=UPI003AFB4C00